MVRPSRCAGIHVDASFAHSSGRIKQRISNKVNKATAPASQFLFTGASFSALSSGGGYTPVDAVGYYLLYE